MGTGRFIRTCHTFIKLKDVNEQTVEAAIQKLQAEGAQVIVASKAFGVDSIKEEAARCAILPKSTACW